MQLKPLFSKKADTMCGHADHPSAYAIVGLEYFLMDQNLSMMGALHSSPP